ncbi:MAG TPA: hypothetical protein VGB09_10950 [Candidatus Binatia bacterium]|jgi:hypothetical protein
MKNEMPGQGTWLTKKRVSANLAWLRKRHAAQGIRTPPPEWAVRLETSSSGSPAEEWRCSTFEFLGGNAELSYGDVVEGVTNYILQTELRSGDGLLDSAFFE